MGVGGRGLDVGGVQIAGYLRSLSRLLSAEHGKKLPVIIKPLGNGSVKLRIGQTDATALQKNI